MRHAWFIGTLAALFVLGCQESPPKGNRGGPPEVAIKNGSGLVDRIKDAKLDDAGGEIRVEGLTFRAPKGWTRKPVQSTFIQAEFVLPRAQEDSLDGRLTLSVAGGTVEANIDRWKDQFGGKPDKSHQEKMDVNGLAVTLVDLAGEYDDKPGPFAKGVKRADYRMIGAIILLGDQLHFVKAVGPKKTMESHAEKIQAFIRSAKK